ncbi:hypothetical protein [Bombella mellum]|uniref:Right handed beta helix domain-containing protein n=1 Tax=Bombella mellum TaxID=2039288 RepID=A0ABR5ZRU5_9PROT|nr:hypothetical protein [Bombella mellum]MBA5726909.1 hypothetical protein [Bombella mellum]
MNGQFGSSRGPASYPAWRQGYTPTAEEWKNVFSNKADAIADNSHQTFDSPTLNNARINDGTIIINGTDHPLSDLIARKSDAILFSSAEEAEKTDISADVTYFIALSRTATSDPATAHYRRVPAQPSHPGRIQSLDGSWWEICSDSVRPEMLATSAIGYKVGENGYATATDDTQALQDAMTVGIELGIPVHLHGKWYRHNSKIYARPLSGTPYPNASPEKGVITRWTTINAPQLVIIGFGNAGIIAGADMTDQLEVYAPDTLGNDAQPQWCRFENIKFDGNDHVSGSNLKLSWSGDAHIKNCGFARAGTGISFHGYGVFLIQHCDIGARFFCIDVQRDGDATITDCDFFIQSIGARIAGNIKFARNILTGTAYTDSRYPFIWSQKPVHQTITAFTETIFQKR